jgi:hypothetical protein
MQRRNREPVCFYPPYLWFWVQIEKPCWLSVASLGCGDCSVHLATMGRESLPLRHSSGSQCNDCGFRDWCEGDGNGWCFCGIALMGAWNLFVGQDIQLKFPRSRINIGGSTDPCQTTIWYATRQPQTLNVSKLSKLHVLVLSSWTKVAQRISAFATCDECGAIFSSILSSHSWDFAQDLQFWKES